MTQRRTWQSGYTLIELLLYMAIVSVLLLSLTYFFGMTADARLKNQTIAEVNEQGAVIMDTITREVRTATSITTPATGVGSTSLTLVVPTGSLSPTVFDTAGTNLGYTSDGGTTDSSDSNSMNATKFTASATGTVAMLYAYIGPTVAASPNNQAQMAIYSGTSSPSTLLASSASTTITSSGWTAFSITPVTVTSGQVYWLAYNTNGLATGDNDLRDHTGTTGQSMFTSRTFGTWPASWSGTGQNVEFSMYAPIEVAASPANLRIKEGAGAVVPLSSNEVHVTGLTFKNLTRSGTQGIVRISFTVSRVNSAGRNEFDYRKTFTGAAEVSW